jgi:hypothetical protein
VEADLWARDLLVDPDLDQFRFVLQIEAANIEIRPNTTSSKWEDVEDMLARGLLVAHHGAETADRSAEARRVLHDKRASHPEVGASLRWSVQAPNASSMSLVLQGLPRPASFLRRDARLTSDICGAVEIARFHLAIPFEAEGPYTGPVPILFSRGPDLSRQELDDHPENIFPGKTYFVLI